MGASSTGLKSNRGDADEEQQRNQPQVIVPRLSIQDVENNNNHIFVNPNENNLHFVPVHALIDECDLLNNNTTFINNNYLTVSLTSPSSTTLTTSFNILDKKQTLYRLSEQQQVQQLANNRKEKMPKESPKKSPKKKVDEKLTKEKEKKKKKEKPKAPRAPAGGAKGGGGGGRGRGMAEQDQMSRRPRKTKPTNQEK